MARKDQKECEDYGPLQEIYSETPLRTTCSVQDARAVIGFLRKGGGEQKRRQGSTDRQKRANGDGTHLRLYDFQIPHLYPARCEVRYLKFHTDRPLALAALSSTSHAAPKPACHTTTMLIISFY